MKIEFMQTGGFAGLSKKFVLDSDDLSDEDKAKLASLTQMSLPLPAAQTSDGMDMQQYEINVDGQQTSLDDGTISAPLRELYDFVKNKVISLKKKV